jgi:hypothetical protein
MPCEDASMAFDLTVLGTQVRVRAAEWEVIGLTWSVAPVHPNYGKAVTWVDFEGAGWLDPITIWETGETELDSLRVLGGLTVNKHYDLESAASLETVLAELAALVRDNTLPDEALAYIEPAAGT